jgi:uncharacterized protein
MKSSSLTVFVLALATLTRAPQVLAKSDTKAPALGWEILAELDYKSGTASEKLKSFNGKEVRVPGFIVPLDFSEAREVSEFLLTPAYPGCMHVPPPTPAQTILVKMEKGSKAKMTWGPIWVTGRLKLVLEKKSGYGEASFEMVGLKTAEYDLTEEGDRLVNQAITGGTGLMPKKATPPSENPPKKVKPQ